MTANMWNTPALWTKREYISLNCYNLAFSLSLFISLLNQKLILKLESDLKMYSYDCGIRWLYGQRGSISHSIATIWPFHFPFFLNLKFIFKLKSDFKMSSCGCGIRRLYGQRGSTSHSTATIWPFHFHFPFPFFLISLSLSQSKIHF